MALNLVTLDDDRETVMITQATIQCKHFSILCTKGDENKSFLIAKAIFKFICRAASQPKPSAKYTIILLDSLRLCIFFSLKAGLI